MKRIIYKQYFRCNTQRNLITGAFGKEVRAVASSISFLGQRTGADVYVTPPTWFTEVNGYPAFDVTWQMTPPNVSAGVWEFAWQVTPLGADSFLYIVKLAMIDYCFVRVGCPTDTITKPLSALLFLTREGGWSYFIFNGKKSFEITIPEAKKYINTDSVTYNNARPGVFNGETLTTGAVELRALDLLQALKQSIQVYYVENVTVSGDQIYKPVILLDRDFVKRKTGEDRFDVAVKFLYADEQQIQTQ